MGKIEMKILLQDIKTERNKIKKSLAFLKKKYNGTDIIFGIDNKTILGASIPENCLKN